MLGLRRSSAGPTERKCGSSKEVDQLGATNKRAISKQKEQINNWHLPS